MDQSTDRDPCIMHHCKISLGRTHSHTRMHTHTQTYPSAGICITYCLHLPQLKIHRRCECVFLTVRSKGHNNSGYLHGTLDRSYLLIDHYHWIITHYFASTFTHSSQSYCWAQQHYVISLLPLPLPSVDVNIWQLCVSADTDFFFN